MRRTSRQRIASARNLIRARQHRIKSHDTLTYWSKAGMRASAGALSFGKASMINTWVSGNYKKKSSKYYRSRSSRKIPGYRSGW